MSAQETIKLLREIFENLNKWTHIPYSWIGKLRTEKMPILPKMIYKVSVISGPSSKYHHVGASTYELGGVTQTFSP